MAEIRPGVYKQKFTHGAFDDLETGLKITHAEEVEVAEPIGRATGVAIQSGRLLYVKPLPKKSEKKPDAGGDGK